jgi:hypothetical protein
MHRKLLCFIHECPTFHVMLNAETIYKRRTMIYTLWSYASGNLVVYLEERTCPEMFENI